MKQPKKQPTIVSERKRSASAKNISDFRAKLGHSPHEKHGISLAINSKGAQLPSLPYAESVRERVKAILDTTVTDLGGPSEITGSQLAVLQSQKLCLTILLLGEEYLNSQGLVDRKSGKAQAVLATLAAFANSARLNSLALGLERKPKFAGTLESRLQQLADAEQSDTEAETAMESKPEQDDPTNEA
jgi:hypothetical protein